MNSSYSVIGFTLASDWLRDWSEFSEPITKRRAKKKRKQLWITLDTQLKIALSLTLRL